jgi:hypothetical protein
VGGKRNGCAGGGAYPRPLALGAYLGWRLGRRRGRHVRRGGDGGAGRRRRCGGPPGSGLRGAVEIARGGVGWGGEVEERERERRGGEARREREGEEVFGAVEGRCAGGRLGSRGRGGMDGRDIIGSNAAGWRTGTGRASD